MYKNYCSRILYLAISLYAIACFILPASAADAVTTENPIPNLIPLPGDPQRKAILDALRKELKRQHGMELVFVVGYIKSKDGWAWVETKPQSPDGRQHYEDVSALLHMRNDTWRVVELPCTEIDDPECLDGPDYFTGLQQRFVDAPADIFPTESGDKSDR